MQVQRVGIYTPNQNNKNKVAFKSLIEGFVPGIEVVSGRVVNKSEYIKKAIPAEQLENIRKALTEFNMNDTGASLASWMGKSLEPLLEALNPLFKLPLKIAPDEYNKTIFIPRKDKNGEVQHLLFQQAINNSPSKMFSLMMDLD